MFPNFHGMGSYLRTGIILRIFKFFHAGIKKTHCFDFNL